MKLWPVPYEELDTDEKRTRLVSRSRVRAQTVWTRLFTYAIEPAGFLMTRRMLLGVKERAEALRARRVFAWNSSVVTFDEDGGLAAPGDLRPDESIGHGS
jgi:hypothetical protein